MRPGNPEALQQPYDPSRVEARWYSFWEERGVFQPRETSGRDKFVIAIPPPNVTGSLTMGHLLGESVRDLIVRWQRMDGTRFGAGSGGQCAGHFGRGAIPRRKFHDRGW